MLLAVLLKAGTTIYFSMSSMQIFLPIHDDSIATTGDSSESTKFVVLKKRKTGGTLDHYIDHLLTPQQKADANVTFVDMTAGATDWDISSLLWAKGVSA
ncbi:hypothetical protein PILCRDRAFT_6394 [Piloderma croceum F 1598]|uniref:Uncharacterized protein n=1 Tax=Piloderma croceum (strain F 1598) TaxID=765440 RepID=A0A0C3C3E8_PILCF|nr:hypothetical protein PILCRDRAFT_6394 [Piloderma croceum F 1598]